MMNICFRANEGVIVKEIAERYDNAINTPFGRPRYKGGQTYQVRRWCPGGINIQWADDFA